jgi:hypothetical protein
VGFLKRNKFVAALEIDISNAESDFCSSAMNLDPTLVLHTGSHLPDTSLTPNKQDLRLYYRYDVFQVKKKLLNLGTLILGA